MNMFDLSRYFCEFYVNIGCKGTLFFYVVDVCEIKCINYDTVCDKMHFPHPNRYPAWCDRFWSFRPLLTIVPSPFSIHDL